ncbi:hypothetical protein OTERR_11310 [Oryzomicrobium terrae]|uniref:DUF1232 domain-containing protein n=1 Tax=Oryzomicrobium terrae TaxID=1735038 RepID=A0A5C1E8S3_9RHOO|nr:DUF1232 domain-containing protein [Oryzomicrobium terrae]QEL64607.1 hypothetical protein OTERR_11310 [Oryzomicrobium terrae]
MSILPALRNAARRLKQEALTVYFIARDPRTPWLVRLLALAVAAYAASPIDLIPDFIPVLGYVDDLLLLPLAIWLILKLVPAEILAASRQRAAALAERPTSRTAALCIVVLWLAALGGLGYWWLAQAAA